MAVRNACRHCGDRHEILLFCAPARFQRVHEAIARRGLWHIRGSWRDRRIGMSDRHGAGDDSREPLILLVIPAFGHVIELDVGTLSTGSGASWPIDQAGVPVGWINRLVRRTVHWLGVLCLSALFG